MKKLLCLLFSFMILYKIQAQQSSHQVTFKLSTADLQSTDSVKISWLLFPVPETKPLFMGNPGADGFYKLTFSFPDSAAGKTLFYRYQTATKRDILRPVVLENK